MNILQNLSEYRIESFRDIDNYNMKEFMFLKDVFGR